MKNQKPSDEAIEAALRYVATDYWRSCISAEDRDLIWPHVRPEHRGLGSSIAYGTNHILAAALHHEREQTKQLRAQIEQLRDHLCHQ